MKSVLNFESWKEIREAKVSEAEGIAPAVYKVLQDFFKEHGDGEFEQAKDYVASKVKGWDLSREDFEEAKKKLK
jgi:hypothetical protein